MAQISRRDFLKGSVATGMLGAVAATGLGCAPAQQTSSEALSETGTVADAAETSSWRVAPESVAEDAIVDETVADIVVIGAGHAGTATARSAAEKSGKSVVLLEALEEQYYTIIGNDIGHLNSQYLKDHGVPEVDPVEFFNDWMMRSQNAANPSLIMQYATRSGEAVDWFLEKVPAELLETMTISYWPRHENMLDEIAGQKFWTGTVQWGMGNEHNMTEVYQAIFASLAELPNLQLIFDRKGVYLEKDGDAVTGVVCVDAAGTYHRYRANEAVVLAAGDFSADKEMMTDLCVTANDCLQEGITEWHDAMGGKDGSGIKMGVWAGGRLEPRPLGSMNGDFAIPSMNPGVAFTWTRRATAIATSSSAIPRGRASLPPASSRMSITRSSIPSLRKRAPTRCLATRASIPKSKTLPTLPLSSTRVLPMGPKAMAEAPTWRRTGIRWRSTWALKARPRRI